MTLEPARIVETDLRIAAASEQPKGLALSWSDGHTSFFHHIWLRDCCHCAACGDCYSSNRLLLPCDLSNHLIH